MSLIWILTMYSWLFAGSPVNTGPLGHANVCTQPGSSEIHNPPQPPFHSWPGRP